MLTRPNPETSNENDQLLPRVAQCPEPPICQFDAGARHNQLISLIDIRLDRHLLALQCLISQYYYTYRHYEQGHGQDFFQGRVLGDSKGELSSHFAISRGSSTPTFARFNGQNERISRPGGHAHTLPMLPTPMTMRHMPVQGHTQSARGTQFEAAKHYISLCDHLPRAKGSKKTFELFFPRLIACLRHSTYRLCDGFD